LIFRYAKKTGDKFIGCSAFPNCTYAEFPEQEKPKILEELCPLCGSHLIERSGKRGSRFIGCSAYPNCHYMRPIKKNPNDKKNNVKADIENQDSDDDMIAVKEDKKKKNAKTK
jgi:DNA topoisomerase-1